MAFVQKSSKLETERLQYIVCSQSTVFFRVVAENNGYKFMTATAPENDGSFNPYTKPNRLISSTRVALNDVGYPFDNKEDHKGRSYLEARGFSELSTIESIVSNALGALGFKDISYLAREEMREIYGNLAIDDSGDDVYMNDGVYLSKDGTTSER